MTDGCIHEIRKLIQLLFVESPHSDTMLPVYELAPRDILNSAAEDGRRMPLISLKAGRLYDFESAFIAMQEISDSLRLSRLRDACDGIIAAHGTGDCGLTGTARLLQETARHFLELAESQNDLFLRIVTEIRSIHANEENRIGDVIVTLDNDLSPMIEWILAARRMHHVAVELYKKLTSAPGCADEDTLPKGAGHSGSQGIEDDILRKIREWHTVNFNISVP